jgi:hypothetical protein
MMASKDIKRLREEEDSEESTTSMKKQRMIDDDNGDDDFSSTDDFSLELEEEVSSQEKMNLGRPEHL